MQNRSYSYRFYHSQRKPKHNSVIGIVGMDDLSNPDNQIFLQKLSQAVENKHLNYYLVYEDYPYLKGYDLVLMSTLPDNNKNRAEFGKIYLSNTGKYIVRDFKGIIHEGQIDTKVVNMDNLGQKLNQSDFKSAILQQTSKAGHAHKHLRFNGLDNPVISTYINLVCSYIYINPAESHEAEMLNFIRHFCIKSIAQFHIDSLSNDKLNLAKVTAHEKLKTYQKGYENFFDEMPGQEELKNAILNRDEKAFAQWINSHGHYFSKLLVLSNILKEIIIGLYDYLIQSPQPDQIITHAALSREILNTIFNNDHIFMPHEDQNKTTKCYLLDFKETSWIEAIKDINNYCMTNKLNLYYLVSNKHLDGLKQILGDQYNGIPIYYYPTHALYQSPLNALLSTEKKVVHVPPPPKATLASNAKLKTLSLPHHLELDRLQNGKTEIEDLPKPSAPNKDRQKRRSFLSSLIGLRKEEPQSKHPNHSHSVRK